MGLYSGETPMELGLDGKVVLVTGGGKGGRRAKPGGAANESAGACK